MFFFSNYCRSNARLVGKTVVITGANCGIGKETARDLYRRGAKVILACRNISKAEEAVKDIKENFSRTSTEGTENDPGQLDICQLDLSSLVSVRKCAQHLLSSESNIHILINNAGVFLHPFEKTEDDFEMHIQVNYLGHFLLTLLLLPKIQESAPDSKIINVASLAHKFGNMHFDDINLERSYSPIKAYCQSKLANILFTKELDKKLKTAGIHDVHVYSLHPGVVNTDLGRHIDTLAFRGARCLLSMLHPFVKSAKQGAQTTLHCALDENAAKESGLYYDNCRVVRSSQNTYNEELAKELWKRTCEFLKLPSEVELGELLKALNNNEVRL